MSEKFETYEVIPPRLWLWRLRTVADLEDAITSCNSHTADGWSYNTYSWGGKLAGVGELYLSREQAIYFKTYHNEYGGGTSTQTHKVADTNSSLVLNLNNKMGLFTTIGKNMPLEARNLPDEMIRPYLRQVTVP